MTRVDDTMTILVIKSLQTSDAGVVKCSCHNRGNPDSEDWVFGTTAEIIVEDKCADGAKFCFDGVARVTVSITLLGLVVFVTFFSLK